MRFLYIVFIVGVFFSCKNQEELSLIQKTEIRCQEEITFICDFEENDEIYFKGKIDNDDFCISSPNNGYYSSYGIGTSSTSNVSNPTSTNLGTNINSTYYTFGINPPLTGTSQSYPKDFSPSVKIKTPQINNGFIYSHEEYIDSFIREGDLVLIDQNVEDTIGFDFEIFWSCRIKPYYGDSDAIPGIGMFLTPKLGSQNNKKFKVTEFTKVYRPLVIKYHIAFEIMCDLYYKNNGEYFGRLEDGVFKTVVEIPR